MSFATAFVNLLYGLPIDVSGWPQSDLAVFEIKLNSNCLPPTIDSKRSDQRHSRNAYV